MIIRSKEYSPFTIETKYLRTIAEKDQIIKRLEKELASLRQQLSECKKRKENG